MKTLYVVSIVFVFVVLFVSCKSNSKDQNSPISSEVSKDTNAQNQNAHHPPDWAKNAVIYEVNLRQYTPEGTINAFVEHLPRLKEMGVDILWFMPIFPISKTKRKGTLGSYYAASDFKAVNPEHGTTADFKKMVDRIHELGMYIILDWVPNHTGWDHKWIKDHPDWYTQDSLGNIIDPINQDTGEPLGWTDVADLNYDNKAMRKEMIKDLIYWIKVNDIDGYRFDVAYRVPNDFWDEVAPALHKTKSVFLLAEAEIPVLRNSGNFIMDYGWTFHHLLNEIAKGTKNAKDIDAYLAEDAKKFKKGYHMHFTSNHDENSWAGTVFERMGDAHKALAVLAATFDGMMLIYGGQEAPLRKKLAFFEKDEIEWNNFAYADFYTTLFSLKEKNKALWNGVDGGALQKISSNSDEDIYAFSREKEGDKVVVILNLSGLKLDFTLKGDSYSGSFTDIFNNRTITLTEDMKLQLNPWDYLVLSNQ